MIGLFVDYL